MARCVDCGFLSLRELTRGSLIEADAGYRKMGVAEVSPFAGGSYAFSLPVCFQGERDFVEAMGVGNPRADQVIPVLQDDIGECSGFTPWRQGFSPKDHADMLDKAREIETELRRDADRRRFETELQTQLLGFQSAQEERQRRREDERDEEMRAREDRRDQDTEQRYEREMTELRKRHKRELLVLGGVLAIATLLAGMIQAGWIPGPTWSP